MKPSPLKVVRGEETPPPANASEALEAAVAKAKAAKASLFILTYQAADNEIVTVSFPDARCFQLWFSAQVHDHLHGLDLEVEPEDPIVVFEAE